MSRIRWWVDVVLGALVGMALGAMTGVAAVYIAGFLR